MDTMPEWNYRSFLADAIRDCLDYLDHLGFSAVAQASNLRRIDDFLVENNIGSMQQCDSLLWLKLMAQYQGRVKGTTLRGWRRGRRSRSVLACSVSSARPALAGLPVRVRDAIRYPTSNHPGRKPPECPLISLADSGTSDVREDRRPVNRTFP